MEFNYVSYFAIDFCIMCQGFCFSIRQCAFKSCPGYTISKISTAAVHIQNDDRNYYMYSSSLSSTTCQSSKHCKKWSQNGLTLKLFWKTVPPWRVEPFFPLRGPDGVKAFIMLFGGTSSPKHVLMRLIEITTRWRYQMVFYSGRLWVNTHNLH